ncbi:hypothetical protein GNI_152880 [Gregarina niphandrodes]|uniref:Uncharacterized protein n=1 Tax=Gregarina niphandrodes TaxID=110365 RepID=A0A023AZB8_GRENI|nr:hypothetical protein GNI_152880 [Gregarina niphandrodes]EZG44068.1 hypothetical protein GNI_152880 [Gregarina niphandrodes]|eukprot:XP_011132825.1 hypothetical protein GNI_152880 [Gregarina niphandrodes]
MRGAACARRRRRCLELLACCFELVEVEPAELAELQTAYRYGTRFFRMRLREVEDAGWGCVQLDPTQVRALHVSESQLGESQVGESQVGESESGPHSGRRVCLHYITTKTAIHALGEPTPPPAWIAANAISFIIHSADERGSLIPLDFSGDPASAASFFRALLTVSAGQLGLTLDQLDPGCLQKASEVFVAAHRQEEAAHRWMDSLRREFAQPGKRLVCLNRNNSTSEDVSSEYVTTTNLVKETATASQDATAQAVAVLAQMATIREICRGTRSFSELSPELLEDVAEAKKEWEDRIPDACVRQV